MPPDARPRRRWVPIVAGVGILLAFLAVGAIVAVVVVVRQALDVQTLGETDATAEFEKIRAQFPNGAPLLELAEGGQPRYTSDRNASSSAGSVETLHLLAWDPDERRLARFSLPFWFLRMKSGPIALGAYTTGLDDHEVDLRPEEIEKHGPGIILDHTTASGERVLFWAQ